MKTINANDLFLAAHHEAAHITVLRHYLPDTQATAFLWLNENAQDESDENNKSNFGMTNEPI